MANCEPAIPNLDPQPKIEGLGDTRDCAKGNEELLYQEVKKTRSGHVIIFSDVEEKEHITVQHRSGSMLQFQPDGSVRFISNNGKMGFEIKGEGYVQVTGAYTIDVKGGASLRVTNDLTVSAKNISMTANETFSVNAKNIVTNADEKISQKAKIVRIDASKEAIIAGNYTYVSAEAVLAFKGNRIDLNPSEGLGIEEGPNRGTV